MGFFGRSQWLGVLLVNCGLLAAGAIVLELVFGNWLHPNQVARLNLIQGRQLHYDARGLYVGAGQTTYTRDKWGLRGAYPSVDRISIVTLGGSATDQRYITDGSTWQDVIAREFAGQGREVFVANAGVDGQSTYGHIKALDWWLPNVEGLKARYLLFYIGGNDLFKVGNTYDEILSEADASWKTRVRDNSAIYNLFYTIYSNYQARYVLNLSHRHIDFGSWQWTTAPLLPDPEPLVHERLERYRVAVAQLARKTRDLGALPIFVTQSLSVYRRRADGVIEGRAAADTFDGARVNGVDLYQMLRLFWAATIGECTKAGGVCLDAGSEINWQPGDFYDVVHNTPQGAERLGKYLHAKLRNLPPGT